MERDYQCVSVLHPTHDIAFITAHPRDPQQLLSFQAGQYVEALLQQGRRLLLSIANAPQSDGELVFHLRHNASHALAQQWLEEISGSSSLRLAGPQGTSTLDRILPGSRLIFLAGGTGFAPIRSLLLELLKQPSDSLPPIDVYWGITHPEDAYERALLTQWIAQYPRFRATVVLSCPEVYPHWEGATGWVHTYCAKHHTQWDNITVFASGPFPMIQAAYHTFTQQGLPSTQFISDYSLSIIEKSRL